MDGLILAAAGSSARFGGAVPKVLRRLAGQPVLVRALAPFRIAAPRLEVVVVVRETDVKEVRTLLPRSRVIPGGATRQESVRRGLSALPPDVETVVVHDAARPLVSTRLVRSVLEAARRDGAAAAVLPVVDTLHLLKGDVIGATVDRSGLVAAQTPQAARAALLREALDLALANGRETTDEISLLTAAGFPVTPVPGERWNLKITVPEDLELARRHLEGEEE
jgi:2-C-methyl-D-erythritol 4-phosphate cytidylyltransferase/2-C-methyl-D-erythritol 2,4-cyclodiphosphate synthase